MTIIDRRHSMIESLSREISDAARDLANRIGFGEFDDLDEGALADLRALSDMMTHWATVAQALEQQRSLLRGALPKLSSILPTAFRN